MKKRFQIKNKSGAAKVALYKTLCLLLLLLSGIKSYGSHILGADLSYTYVSGNTYKITVTLFGDCGSTSGAFPTLQITHPEVCIYDGSTSITNLALLIDTPICGTEVTPLCAGDISQCTSPTSVIPGIKKFVYSGNYTLPHTSAHWRFIYSGENTGSGPLSCGFTGTGTAAAAGRSSAITNITPGTTIQLIDTLNNSVYHNTSPLLNSIEQSFFCLNEYDNYSPLAVDPDGDSLYFSLVPATNGSPGTCTIGGSVMYAGIAWPGNPISGATPLSVLAGSFSINTATGQILFKPNILQRSVVVYNIREFRSGILVGTSQREMTFSVTTCPVGSLCTGTPYPGTIEVYIGCSGLSDTLSLSGYSCGVTFQWQYSTDGSLWTNFPGAISSSYPIIATVSRYYRCAVTCPASGQTYYSDVVFFPVHGQDMLCVINTPDTICNGPDFYISTCHTSSHDNVTTFFGDGTSNNIPLTATPVCHADDHHNYSMPGTYSIKQVLYDGVLAIDSNIFSYHYLYCNTLPVIFYIDNNNDCIFDSGDNYLSLPIPTEVDSNGIPIDTISATSGFYYKAFGGPGSIYSFRALQDSSWIVCPLSGIIYDTIVPLVNNYPVKYFGLNPSTYPRFDLAINAVVPVTGVNDEWGNIYVQNLSCFTENATLTLNYSPKYASIPQQISPPATSISGNTIVWNLSSVSSVLSAPIDVHYSIWSGSTALTVGDTVQSYFTIDPVLGDMNSNNNAQIIINTVRAGCDPNEIWVNPSCIASGDAATQLQYTINFENTGNDTAFNIHVMDTLPSNVNPHSLRLVMASASMNIALFTDNVYNIAKFDFPGINLLDSTHHGQCDGAVIFTINTVPGLPDGTTIFNRAGIYFDDNSVVMTNTVENIIGCSTTAVTLVNKPGEVEVYPNPATNELFIKMTPDAYNSYTITNTVGQTMLQQTLNATLTKVSVKMLPAGVYYITFRGENGTKVEKFVKM